MRRALVIVAISLALGSCSVMTYFQARMGQMFYENGDYTNAIRFYMNAVADRDERAETFYWLGMSFYRRGDLEEAMLALEKSLEKDSTDVVVIERLAAVNLDLGHFDRAEYYCRNAIQTYDGYIESFNTLGHVFFEKGELDSAASCFQYVLTKSGEFRWQSIAELSFESYNEEKAEAHNGLGEICIARGLLPQALDYFNAAISLAYHWETPWFNKGRAYEALGNTRAAEVAYQRTIDIAPRNTIAYKTLARMYRRVGKDSEAMKLYWRAISADSLDSDSYVGLAQIQEELGDNWKAAELYERAVTKAPDEPQGYANAGRTNMLIGRYDLAVDYLSQLVELQPERAEVHNSLGEACLAAGDSTEARREFEEAITIDSLYTLPLRNLGSLLIKQGNEAEGFDFYIRAARLGDGPASDFLRLRGIKWN